MLLLLLIIMFSLLYRQYLKYLLDMPSLPNVYAVTAKSALCKRMVSGKISPSTATPVVTEALEHHSQDL